MSGAIMFHSFFIYKIFITMSMMYKQQVLNLTEVMTGKLRIIEGAATGAMQLSHSEILQLIKDSQKINERIAELITIERE
jgi:hypothetical protein